jgi:phosphomannomutase
MVLLALDQSNINTYTFKSTRNTKKEEHLRADVLGSVMYKVAILAALRSKKLQGSTIGVMITASHNPEEVYIQ